VIRRGDLLPGDFMNIQVANQRHRGEVVKLLVHPEATVMYKELSP
jgi:hypothetical protein